MTAPPENAGRFPNLPLTRLVPLAAMIEQATKAVVGQVIRLAPPNSATMLGGYQHIHGVQQHSAQQDAEGEHQVPCHERPPARLSRHLPHDQSLLESAFFMMLLIKKAISFLIGCEHAVGQQQQAALHT